MDPVATVRDISQIVKKYNDLELMKRIVDLQTAIFDLNEENLQLKKDVALLRADDENKSKMTLKTVGATHQYFREGDSVPFCQKCFETEGKSIHLSPQEHWNGGVRRHCVKCDGFYYEVPMDLRQKPISARGF